MAFLETKWHSESKMTFQVRIAKLLTSNSIPKLNGKFICGRTSGFGNFQLAAVCHQIGYVY